VVDVLGPARGAVAVDAGLLDQRPDPDGRPADVVGAQRPGAGAVDGVEDRRTSSSVTAMSSTAPSTAVSVGPMKDAPCHGETTKCRPSRAAGEDRVRAAERLGEQVHALGGPHPHRRRRQPGEHLADPRARRS
jgi:hypothetical protein